MPGPHLQGADDLGFLEQALCRADQPEPAPILDPEGNKYHVHWQGEVPLYHKTTVTVHSHHDLRVDGHLEAYECVGPGWQLNVLLTHVPFGEETKDFLDALRLAYRRLSLLAATIIIGDLNAAPADDNRTGPPRATDMAVRDSSTSEQDSPADPPTTPTRPAATPPELTRATGTQPRYASTRQPTGTTRMRARATDPSTTTSPSSTYPRPQLPCLTTPSHPRCGSRPRTTTALGTGIIEPYTPSCAALMRQHSRPPCARQHKHADLTFQQLVHDIWTAKDELATLLHPSTPETLCGDAHLCAFLTTRRHQLLEWHARRIAAAAQERKRYRRNDTLYKSLRYVSRVLEETGRRTIHAVRTPDGGLTNDPDTVLEAVLDSSQA